MIFVLSFIFEQMFLLQFRAVVLHSGIKKIILVASHHYVIDPNTWFFVFFFTLH